MKRRLGKIAAAFFVLVLATGAATWAQAQTFTTLHSFDKTDGAIPEAGLVQATDGNFYGTTLRGGANSCIFSGTAFGCGTVFKITPSGTLTTLHSFDGTDGEFPEAGLVQATDGNFYGTTLLGGANGFGTVFKITPSGALTTLHSFNLADGLEPEALVQAADGNFYSITTAGGANFHGTAFKITTSGTLTTLYSFCSQSGCTDGSQPLAGLVQATDGNFYGTTSLGGANGDGTVFKITPSGTLTTLHSFDGTDGDFPYNAGLVQATDGNFYGTTGFGGANHDGTVFKITPSGTLTTLYSFCSQSGCTDGVEPIEGLVQATDGNFYGTTLLGGANSCILSGTAANCGTVFKITPSGALTTLHSFDGTDGELPVAALVQGSDGNLYGTTSLGGANRDGTVFSLSVTPQQATEAIINSVNKLFSQGVINGGQDNSLVVKLQHAIARLNAGNKAAAIGNLNAFVGEVNDLLSSGVLSPSQAASLVSAAESVIAVLP